MLDNIKKWRIIAQKLIRIVLPNIINSKLNLIKIIKPMEINSLKNKMFDRLYDDVSITIDQDCSSVQNGAIFVVHRVGTSLRFDRLCYSVDDALSVARKLVHENPNYVYSIVVESVKLIHYANLKNV